MGKSERNVATKAKTRDAGTRGGRGAGRAGGDAVTLESGFPLLDLQDTSQILDRAAAPGPCESVEAYKRRRLQVGCVYLCVCVCVCVYV